MARVKSRKKRKKIAEQQKKVNLSASSNELTQTTKPAAKGLLRPNQEPIAKSAEPIRLSKVLKELNVGMNTVIHFFESRGIRIEPRPNFKLNPEHIDHINGTASNLKNSFVSDYSIKLMEDLKIDYNIIFSLTPEQFEKIVATFLEKSGFEVMLNGKTNQKDGGVDIIAWKRDVVAIVIAVQVKFKTREENKVTSSEVRDLMGVLDFNPPFHAGMLVTNSFFTSDARYFEERAKIELKDSQDLKSWLQDNFVPEKPFELDLEIAKDVRIKI